MVLAKQHGKNDAKQRGEENLSHPAHMMPPDRVLSHMFDEEQQQQQQQPACEEQVQQPQQRRSSGKKRSAASADTSPVASSPSSSLAPPTKRRSAGGGASAAAGLTQPVECGALEKEREREKHARAYQTVFLCFYFFFLSMNHFPNSYSSLRQSAHVWRVELRCLFPSPPPFQPIFLSLSSMETTRNYTSHAQISDLAHAAKIWALNAKTRVALCGFPFLTPPTRLCV